jgi:hypothetical protein
MWLLEDDFSGNTSFWAQTCDDEVAMIAFVEK